MSNPAIPVATAVSSSTTFVEIDNAKIERMAAQKYAEAVTKHWDDMTKYKQQLKQLESDEATLQIKKDGEQRRKHDDALFNANNPKVVEQARDEEFVRLKNEEFKKTNENERRIKRAEADARTELLLKDKRRGDFLFKTKFAGYMFIGVGLSLIVTASHL